MGALAGPDPDNRHLQPAPGRHLGSGHAVLDIDATGRVRDDVLEHPSLTDHPDGVTGGECATVVRYVMRLRPPGLFHATPPRPVQPPRVPKLLASWSSSVLSRV